MRLKFKKKLVKFVSAIDGYLKCFLKNRLKYPNSSFYYTEKNLNLIQFTVIPANILLATSSFLISISTQIFSHFLKNRFQIKTVF